MNTQEFFLQFMGEGENQPGPTPVKVYCDGELYDVDRVTFQQSEDPDVEPAIVIIVK
jgi:hypothetical protein